uniref:Retroelement pol polyprotein n=1 Tax=Oryza sativa subsp. japonica TaxID=39947 RepID=Q8S849_ORYSJ|nr:Putative retroelement pol polyprotein [Oryza sativa Japonica Group]
MPGLSRSIVECRLPVKPGVRPYQQPPRRCKAYMLEPVKAEVKRLYDAGFIHPYRYAEWVSNIVPVIKKNGKVRVCIDFRDLNKATRKDEYPMPVADQLVNAASGHEILSFMDGNAGYNQIFMAEEDIHMTAFRCPGAIGLFEWVVMTFGLKSAGATYQRAMNYIFHDLIGWLVEVYIDDVVVKSKEIENHIADLRKVFEKTRKYGLKMNPIKCAFGVSAGQFLGFLVHERGIEITQMSVNAIKKIQPPEDKTELQELIGKINFVRRFISNLSGRLEPFTPLLRLKADQEYTWGAEQQKAFDSIKEYLSSPPVSIPPQKGMAFRLYLSAGEKSIGSVLIRELEEKERVVFYLSRRLLDAETRVGKWIFALTEFDLRYESPKAIKGQAIADFIVDHLCTHGCGIGLVIISPLGASFEFAYTIKPDATNNQAEYEAVLKGLQLLKEVEADAIEIMGDSLLVICQLAGEYECKNDTLMVYNENMCLESKTLKLMDLAQGALGFKPMMKDVKVEVATITADDWRYDVFQYLQNPSQSASRKLRYKALKYTLLDDELYYRTIDGVLLKCLSADQAKVAIGEVHEGICGTNQSAHNMKWSLRRAGYFWPIMLEDCFKYYKGCQDCQKFGAIQRAPASAMNPIIKPWPFRAWGIDMIGMINPPSSKGHKFILVATDYFTKWIEAIPLKKVPPYKLVYGHEAVLPWEVRIGSRRMDLHDQLTADEYYNLMADEKEDLVQSRLRALAKVTKDKERIARHYNKKVVPKSFSEGELVWKLILPIGTRDNKFGKWSPNWEGPFQIHKVVSKGAYREVYGRALNGKYLKKCYPSVWVHT